MNGGKVRRTRPITASHLYDFAVCEHRVTLDFTLDRSQRTPPNEAGRLLIERGQEIEARLAAAMGHARVEPQPDRPEAAFEETLALMRGGCAGIVQGVLLDGRRLAIPDLLRRVEGDSSLGGFHYAAGDIKSGVEPRTDQVLQVLFSARLLETIQGRRPEIGFLVMANGEESVFRIEEVWDSASLALKNLEAIVDGIRSTQPFLSEACGRCRWRGTCLPDLESRADLSLVAGMTPTRGRVLRSQGVGSFLDLAALTEERITAMTAGGVPTEGVRPLRSQARALMTGRPVSTQRRRAPDLPGLAAREREPTGRGRADSTKIQPPGGASQPSGEARSRNGSGGARGAHGGPATSAAFQEDYLLCEWDPLTCGQPGLVGWGTRSRAVGSPGRFEAREILIPSGGSSGCDEAARTLMQWVGSSEGPIFHFGGAVPRLLDWVMDRSAADPVTLGRIEGRLCNLALLVRRGAYLPVRRYRFEEVCAVVQGRPLPAITEEEDAVFVWLESRRLGIEGDWEARILQRAETHLESLAGIMDWLDGVETVDLSQIGAAASRVAKRADAQETDPGRPVSFEPPNRGSA